MTSERELFLVSFPKTIKILSLALCISSDENVKTGGFISWYPMLFVNSLECRNSIRISNNNNNRSIYLIKVSTENSSPTQHVISAEE